MVGGGGREGTGHLLGEGRSGLDRFEGRRR